MSVPHAIPHNEFVDFFMRALNEDAPVSITGVWQVNDGVPIMIVTAKIVPGKSHLTNDLIAGLVSSRGDWLLWSVPGTVQAVVYEIFTNYWHAYAFYQKMRDRR